MPDEVIIEGDQPPAAAPVVVTVVTPESDSGPDADTLAELEELRTFKAKVEEDRLAEAERVAQEAARTANLALEIALENPVEEEIIEAPEENESHEEPKEDVPPVKSHAWFKEF